MLCSITDGLQPEDIPEKELPPPVKLIGELPEKIANEAICDYPYEPAGNGRTHIEEIVRHAMLGDAVETMEAVLRMVAAAGRSDFAVREWEKL